MFFNKVFGKCHGVKPDVIVVVVVQLAVIAVSFGISRMFVRLKNGVGSKQVTEDGSGFLGC
jgi:hypothetical protein